LKEDKPRTTFDISGCDQYGNCFGQSNVIVAVWNCDLYCRRHFWKDEQPSMQYFS